MENVLGLVALAAGLIIAIVGFASLYVPAAHFAAWCLT